MATIRITEDGPYRVEGEVSIRDSAGNELKAEGIWHLCRCGGSRNKPFCDATHGLKGWSGPETAARGSDTPADGPPSITPTVDGPYEVCGAIRLVGADGEPYGTRQRQKLCRCGHSGTKPFCDGSHRYAGFRDPLPPELENTPTVYAWLGGREALERLTAAFYDGILNEPDDLLEPVFRGMDPEHPKHVAAWLGETFGGPPDYTAHHGGYDHMVQAHRGRALTEEQRQRWVARLARTADEVLLPGDPDVRQAFLSYLDWGSRIALFNSQPGVEVIAHAPVPQWGWGNATPYVPQPWDDPDAAAEGRAREPS
jgi:CDGSH-type Zn-finger protein/truncated hemoglobin YjbI